ncbi:MAG: 2-amino-4-hydroxy-6-hydroxymethyldihydropteridine diphosphokinase [Pseudomonadales bacterium]|nr:2-amino-4-hydroxy-6-hydroxymethyldihydropteridine diphosphokinase [Pseudomonadales bacterium]
MNTQRNTTATRPEASTVVISLGANLQSKQGTPARSLLQVMERLRELSCGYFEASSLYRTSAVDCPPGTPDFLNAVVVFDADPALKAADLLQQLHAMEAEFGRVRTGDQNQSRTMDLDLIAFGGMLSERSGLLLPHPRAHLRRFVLEPLSELRPDLILPGHTETVADLLAELGGDETCQLVLAPNLTN